MFTKNKKTYEELEIEINFLHNIIDSASDGIYAVDCAGNILIYNKSFERMEGTKRINMLGKKDMDVYSTPFEEDFLRIAVSKNKKPLLEQHVTYTIVNGKKVDAIYNFYPFYENGELTAMYLIGRDVTTITELLAKYSKLLSENKLHQKTNGTNFTLEDIIGNSIAIKKIVREARKVAQIRSTVMIHGETGTGKELFAQGIHNASPYASGPFIAVNCAAIPDTLMESLLMGTVKGAFTGAIDMPGLFEQAENGTIFLDEINSLGIHLQAKLLRLLQDHTVRRIGGKTQLKINCRIISATNQDLFEADKNGGFRSDLLYRLTPVVLAIPPLRERLEDIPLLTEHFISRFNTDFSTNIKQIRPEMLELFFLYKWPGNVRELEHMIESALCMTDHNVTVLSVEHLPEFIRRQIQRNKSAPINVVYLNEDEKQLSLDEFRRQSEKSFIEAALKKNNGSVSNTAKQLGISRQNLHYYLRTLEIIPYKYKS